MKPYFSHGDIAIYLGDAASLLCGFDLRESVVLTGPPYFEHPHVAVEVINRLNAATIISQWDDNVPPCRLPHVATYLWHHSDTGRIQHFYRFDHDDSQMLSDIFVAPTIDRHSLEYMGCPWQFPLALSEWLLRKTPELPVFDPFCGSGTVLLAAKRLGRTAIGIEVEERYAEMAAKRIYSAY